MVEWLFYVAQNLNILIPVILLVYDVRPKQEQKEYANDLLNKSYNAECTTLASVYIYGYSCKAIAAGTNCMYMFVDVNIWENTYVALLTVLVHRTLYSKYHDMETQSERERERARERDWLIDW